MMGIEPATFDMLAHLLVGFPLVSKSEIQGFFQDYQGHFSVNSKDGFSFLKHYFLLKSSGLNNCSSIVSTAEKKFENFQGLNFYSDFPAFSTTVDTLC